MLKARAFFLVCGDSLSHGNRISKKTRRPRGPAATYTFVKVGDTGQRERAVRLTRMGVAVDGAATSTSRTWQQPHPEVHQQRHLLTQWGTLAAAGTGSSTIP